jgi:hypothetical protein
MDMGVLWVSTLALHAVQVSELAVDLEKPCTSFGSAPSHNPTYSASKGEPESLPPVKIGVF